MSKILLVEDMPDLRAFAALALRQAGHEVVEADNGQSAYDHYTEAIADRNRFDLVVMDVAMPGLNGIDAAQKIRNLWPEQKIAFLTAMNDPLTGARAELAGGTAFWSKPLTAPELCAKVAALL